MSKKNPILDRAIIAYLHPKYHCLFIAECHSNISGKSEQMQRIVKKHYDSMSENDKCSLKKLFIDMSEDQKKNPKK